MSEVKKKKKRAPPPPGKIAKTIESQNGKENLPKQGKKKAPTPKPVIARQLSDKNQAVKLPGPTDLKQLDEARRKLSSTKSIDEQKPEKRFTYSEFLHDDNETDDIFTSSTNTPQILEEPEPEQEVIIEEEQQNQVDPEQEMEPKVDVEPEVEPTIDLEVEPVVEPEVEPEPEIEPNSELETEIEAKVPNTNGVTIIDDELRPEETDFDTFSVQSVSSTHSSRRNTGSSTEVHENIKSEEEVKTPEIFPEKTEFVNAVNLLRKDQNSKMGRTDSQGWNRKVIPSGSSTDSSEPIGHNEILNEIQLLKEQISKIKEKKNMNSTKTPIPFQATKAAIVFKSGLKENQMKGEFPKPIPNQKSIKLDEDGNIVHSVQEAKVIVNNHGKGQNEIDTSSYNKSIELDEFGNIIRSNHSRQNSIQSQSAGSNHVTQNGSKIIEKPGIIIREKSSPVTSPPNSARSSTSNYQMEASKTSSYGQTQFTPPPPKQLTQKPIISKKPELRRQDETDGDIPRALTYAQMEQRHLELQNQYQQYQNQYHHQNGQFQNGKMHSYQYNQQPMSGNGQIMYQQQQYQFQQQPQQYQHQQYHQFQQTQFYQQQTNQPAYKGIDYSLPPSIYNQPPNQIQVPMAAYSQQKQNGNIRPPQYQYGQYQQNYQPINNQPNYQVPIQSERRKSESQSDCFNSDGISSTSESSGSVAAYESPVNGTDTPFGKKLSLKKPRQREVVRQLTDREKLLDAIQNVGPYQPGLARQLSETNGYPDGPGRRESISSEMSTSSSVFLKPVSQRELGPKLIQEEPSQRDLLFAEIKRAASVSDDHIYDGTGPMKHNGTNGQSASAQPAPITTPNPPTPPPAPLLRPVGSRQIKQKEIVKEKSLNEQLMEQIRKSTSVSDEYIFDGSNQEVVPRQNNNSTIKAPERKIPTQSTAPLQGRDLLLSEIQNGFQLKKIPQQ